MSLRMIHPGPRAPVRMAMRQTRLLDIEGVLPACRDLTHALGALFAAHGCRGGVAWLDGAVCAPLRYVLPAHATDGIHGAWYSDTHQSDGPWSIGPSTATVGWKDGAPFVHCHGMWGPVQRMPRVMGHLLPAESVLARDVQVRGIGALDAWMEAAPDPETGFVICTPKGLAPPDDASGLLLRVAPFEDAVTAIETACAALGIRDAELHGIGSIDHVHFEEGHVMACHATELRLAGAWLAGGRAHVPIEVVDIDGRVMSGTLQRGRNPVAVTLELLIRPWIGAMRKDEFP